MIRVLVVDDDKLARKGLISIVPWEKCGMKVVGEAANGQKAMEFLEENAVDLAVVDLSMPVMTGLQFIEKSRVRWPKLQYVVLTFHEDFQSVQSALRLGTLDYISKMRLDQQDCAEVFKRVSMMIQKDRKEIQTQDSAAEQVNDNGWEEIQSRWLAFYWMYTGKELNALCDITKKHGPSFRILEHLLVRISDTASKLFEVEELPAVPPVNGIEDAIEWIKELKYDLVQKIVSRSNSKNTAACMLKATDYVKANIAADLSMNVVAQKVNISRSYFAVNFKKATGITFNNFLRLERVNRAKELLEQGEIPSRDIAQAVGYEDEKYFAQVFASQTGLSPAEYKVKHTKKAV